jgi:hypothetical protein
MVRSAPNGTYMTYGTYESRKRCLVVGLNKCCIAKHDYDNTARFGELAI